MPKLWTQTVEDHRRAVRGAALDATAKLIAEHGLRSVTMSQVAALTGIGRATLYKYFPDVEALVTAWHRRQVAEHLAQLHDAADGASGSKARLQAVLGAYARIRLEHPDMDAAGDLHSRRHVDEAEQHLRAFLVALLADCVETGEVRGDMPGDELAVFCLCALAAARDASSESAADRLVELTLAALRPVDEPTGSPPPTPQEA